MDIKQLRALIAVAETGSVTRAAEMLHVVQPAVSRQLRLLEEDIGAALFERGRYGMELTEQGEILAEYTRRALRELDRARAEIQPTSATIQGIVTIGLLPSTADLLASPLLTTVSSLYPGVRLRISIGFAGHLQNWLESGEVDAALLYDPKPSPMLNVSPLLEENLWVVGPASSNFAAERPVSLAELAGVPLILPSAPHALRTLVEHAFALAKQEVKVVVETNAMSVQRNLVLAGHGLTILPSIAVADDIARGLLKAAPLTSPELQRKIVLALPNTRRVTLAVSCVVKALTSEIKNAIDRGDWTAAHWVAEESHASR
ncbi:LysR family transcriptional regulator [Pseudogulbenkiania ferrooxidans]|uniref:Transcriptional regulator, LysR family n=1 Tax=Pseudogulbenkiania ferrooxidans 2002 TaxID=279714 RepID=B9Z0M9_9NEIS|nr:LysR substrate-binding domain-containing protein [Pseudogulbenkiania ferrooxidans]EEG09635.1 transcriptional regulator, LysR family [Pseudogulbenkiania ferrooxidans 2002]